MSKIEHSNMYPVPSDDEFGYTDSEIRDEAMKGVAEYEEQKREQAVLNLFDSNCYDLDFKELPWYLRAFYWVKAFLCAGFAWIDNKHYWDRKDIVMINWDGAVYPDGESWDCMSVGCGVFKNWWVCIYRDGT